MTFKSIETILEEADASGVLKRFLPALDDDQSEKRRLLISKHLQNDLYVHPAHLREYYAHVRARLKNPYVIGKGIYDDDKFFRRLDPEGNPNHRHIWEVRITFAPTMRIFGAFLDYDRFVALFPRPRKDLDYTKAMQKVDADWNSIFLGHSRCKGWPLSNCISNCGERI